ncbi:spore cortex formation protein SpoVR/YcgB (stage V sporulation) [Nitrospirillum viridazoti]|uniref:Spore cortex formation protein SpoVR/YcgB (Stage V sporulation) n=1 Tax=Nitrospirillum amazonense TaxID=28077 RepID=A0A560JFI7_9PROT|nr:spore cortex formation protein SpoVR/YcgB (stage V sporulation) [Nitrospirillum amazonense]TWB68094.1 spore cortex formation protein SpoVR/YcgB (stage V sporulation) [Nitrospirillum amazonense]
MTLAPVERLKPVKRSEPGEKAPPPDDANLLYTGADWDYDTIKRCHDAIQEIALGELGLDVYPNQIEVITSEQMLDAYASIGMPLLYRHWSFGKHFARDEAMYRRGMRGLAYEIVINSSPCISYIMEENSITMQALVIAHAAFGHNHFFKNNYLFQQWTDAEGILGYLDFAKAYIARCEERYGQQLVERTLDAAHALMNQGIHRYPRRRLDLQSEARREQERQEMQRQLYNDLWRTVPTKKGQKAPSDEERRRALLDLPEENILYFLEKKAPRLANWQREVLRIVRHVAQYFSPQRQTKVMNEGCATYTHYRIMTRLHETGRISDGAYMEFLHSHTAVVFQPAFDDPRYSGINPYALGFAMMQDIERIATNPTEEDRAWFPGYAGSGDAMAALRDAWANYRDESFILQYLSPHLMRKMRMFHLHDNSDENVYRVAAIHDERGYRRVRQQLAAQYDFSSLDPDIQITDVDLAGDRRLILEHKVQNGVLLAEEDAKSVLQHVANLWGYDVLLFENDDAGNTLRKLTVPARTILLAE